MSGQLASVLNQASPVYDISCPLHHFHATCRPFAKFIIRTSLETLAGADIATAFPFKRGIADTNDRGFAYKHPRQQRIAS